MRYRPLGTDPDDPRFGRLLPDDWEHLDKYPLTALMSTEQPTRAPVVIGVNWYEAFDRPQRSWPWGEYWIGRDGNLGRIRGGHAVCLEPGGSPDLTSWWRFYNQGMEGACFPAGTHVRMADGSQRRIEDVRLLDEVVTAEGRTGYVLHTMTRLYSRPLVRINAWGHSHLRCTPEHPILTRRGYVPARELTTADWIMLPKYFPIAPSQAIIPSGFVDVRRAPSRQHVQERVFNSLPGRQVTQSAVIAALPDKIELTAAFGRLIGLYAAEGSQSENRVVWSYGSHEKDTLVQETVDLISRVLGAEAHVRTRPNNCINVVLYGKHWRFLFAALVPGTSKHGDKHLSPYATNGPPDFLRALLDGWYDGDGYMRRRDDREYRDGVTVCAQLALDMHAIATACGLRPAIKGGEGYKNIHALTRQYRWNLTFPVSADADAPEEIRYGFCQCGCGNQVSQERRHRISRYLPGHGVSGRGRVCQDGHHMWRRVREVVEDPCDFGYVFNLHVEGDESYVAEGIGVHNCVGFAWSRCMSLLNKELYAARWLWDRCKEIDQWPETNPGDQNGTSVRAGGSILISKGHVDWQRVMSGDTVSERARYASAVPDGIVKYRWARSVDEVHTVLGNAAADRKGAVPILNSWGRGYPQRVWMPDVVLERLLREDGECAVPTDR